MQGPHLSHYVQWLTNSIKIKEKFVLRNTNSCYLCSTHYRALDARHHLLTECKETEMLRSQYIEALLEADINKAAEFYSLPANKQWLWILSGGCLPAPPPKQTGRRSPFTTIFQAGKCFQINKDNDSVGDVVLSFAKYHAIFNEISRSSYHIYTDGSKQETGNSGAAAIIKLR